MRSLLVVLGMALLAMPAAAEEASKPQARIAPADLQFLSEAASGNIAEQELGRLAEARGRSERVKRFGRHMVEDHGRLQQQLETVAREQGVALPTSMTPAQRATVARLSKLEGEAFDRAYMEAMNAEHAADVRKFERAAETARDPAVQRLARESVPVLQEHLQTARDVGAEVRGATSGRGAGER